jgi:hypothetical protein
VDAGIGFPHARLAVQLIRRRRSIDSTTWSSETVYAITSLPWHQARPDLIADALEAGHHCRAVAGADLGQVLAEGHVADPVQCLDPPVPAGRS